jgi:hypothetical protein
MTGLLGPRRPHTREPIDSFVGPAQLAFHDPETDVSFAFLTNGYPTAGYDSRGGVNAKLLIADPAGDLA